MSAESSFILWTILGWAIYITSAIVLIYILWLVIRALRKYLREDDKVFHDPK